MTIYDYFDRLTSIGLDEEISEEFDNKIIDVLENVRNQEMVILKMLIDDEPTDKKKWLFSTIQNVIHDGYET